MEKTQVKRAETQEVVPRYYGLSFPGESGIRIFDNPSTAAMAYVAITSPDTKDGLTCMLKEWQARKGRELAGEFGYEPLFKLSKRWAKRLLECPLEELVKIVRESIRKNHSSYNLWESSGVDAVSDLVLRGEVLTADVRSQKEGKYHVSLKGAVRGRDGEIRYSDCNCNCKDNNWSQTKGGQRIATRRNCIHIKAAELDSFLQDTRTQHPLRRVMREKEVYEGQRSLTFNFVDDPFLRHLIADVLIAREVLGQNAYDLDRKLLSPPIGAAIMPISLQELVLRGKAKFEVLKQKRRVRKIDSDVLRAQEIVDEEFGRELRRAGYFWQGHCLELGEPADRYENGMHAVSLVMGELPFYVVRNLQNSRSPSSIFTPDYAPQNPFRMALMNHQRIDDRTRKMTSCMIEPAVRINVPGVNPRTLRYDIPLRVIEAYRQEIRKSCSGPEGVLKALRIKY